jgi:lipocalin
VDQKESTTFKMDFLDETLILIKMDIIRYKGKWFKITPKPYEAESQTTKIAWALAKDEKLTPQEAYLKYFEKQRKEARILYPSFRKDDN